MAAPSKRYPVRLGLADGVEIAGALAEVFSPYQTTLTLRDEAGRERRIPTLDVAYVGIVREGTETASRVPPPEGERVRLALAPGKTLDLIAPPPSRWGALGFIGVPEDRASPFSHVFVYRARLGEHRDEMRPDAPTTLATRGMRAASDANVQALRTIGELLRSHKSNPPVPPATNGAAAPRRLRLGELLVEAGVVTLAHVEQALREQQRSPGTRLGELLFRAGVVGERDLSRILAERFHLPFVDLDQCLIDDAALEGIPAPLLLRHRVLPLEADPHALIVAIADPPAADALDALRLQSGKRIRPVVVTPSQLASALAKRLGAAPSARAAAADEPEFDVILSRVAASGASTASRDATAEVAPSESDPGVIQLVNRLLLDAFRRGASDIHVEAVDRHRGGRVRLRVDGDCVAYHDLPLGLMAPVVTRLKIMADLDIAERRKPQDGKIRTRLDGGDVELRVATLPTTAGEAVVLRLLPPAIPRPLDQMGLSERNLRELRAVLENPYGLFLCVGPTGSGKTTTLHSALAGINTPATKIWTIEDPVEISQPGLCQVQVQRKAGLDFATALRAFLRADPDVIMVGEMRDLETASTAVEASLTGHLVLSTLHTNSAAETLTRLLEMGIEPFSFADALLGVIAQRLVRSLCSSCLEPYAASPHERKVLETARATTHADGELLLWRGAGCPTCNGSGYRGRVAIHELLVVDRDMRDAMIRRAPAEHLRDLAIAKGMTTLLEDGVAKALAGVTDLRNVLGACSR